jgi:hypothetical protein
MSHFRVPLFSAVGALLSLTVSAADNSINSTIINNPNSVCNSYGVDFVDEGHYFINSISNDNFTSVSRFMGCNTGLADVLFIDPNGDEMFCSQLPTTPDDTPELSTCPILKSQMFTGKWILLFLGNNGDGNPFAWERGKCTLSLQSIIKS